MLGYEAELAQAVRRVEGHPHSGFDEITEQLVLANLHNLFGELDWDGMRRTARAASVAQFRAVLDQRHADRLLDSLSVEDDDGVLQDRRPSIFVSGHLGGYRLVVPLLASLGHRLTVVMDAGVADQQGATFMELFEEFRTGRGLVDDALRIRSTSETGLLLGMAKDVRQGRSLVLYIDANKGRNRLRGADHSVDVPFFGGVIASRVGIPVTALVSRARIVPIWMRRGATLTDNDAVIGVPLDPDDVPRDDFIRATLATLWADVEKAVRTGPADWEAIRYVHEYLRLPPRVPRPVAGRMRFNRRRFAVRTSGRRAELFDRQEYAVRPVFGRLRAVIADLERADYADLARPRLTGEDVEWLKGQDLLVGGG